MQHLGLLFTIGLILLNLWGATLVTGMFWRSRWVAAMAAPWLLTTVFYAIESYHGLGSLRGVGFLGSITSLGLVFLSASNWRPSWFKAGWAARMEAWRYEFSPRSLLPCGAVFVAVFGYALAWRFVYPNVDGSSEKLADLSYISSYLSGQTLPVPDAWLHPYRSAHYYSFQHYAAALMGRLLGLSSGATYNLAFCVLIGVGAVSFAGGVWLVCRSPWKRVVVLLGFVIGGSGMSGVIHLLDDKPTPWSSMRFVGSAPLDKAPLGTALKAYQDQFPKMELPGEPYSYSIFLGDYHAPLASYLLLGVAVSAVILWEREQRRRYLLLVGGTLTWTLLANTWALPLQGLALAGWMFYRKDQFRVLVTWVGGGAAAVWLLSWVYLSAFTSAASGYGTSLKLVPWTEHTPPLMFALFLFPTLVLVLLGWFSGDRVGQWLAQLWSVLLVFSEFVYVDDVYSGMYNRFNTSLKWWPLIAAGVLLTLGPILLERTSRRWIRGVALFLCLYPCAFVWDLGKAWKEGPKEAMGKIDGTYFLTREMFPRLILGRLKEEPTGVVIERPTKDGFTNSACLPLFAGHRMWLGWLGHEQLWRGYREDLPLRQDTLFKFFDGQLPASREWLLGQGIDYVLWYQEADSTALWTLLNEQLKPSYLWVEIFTHDYENGRKVGFWRRMEKADFSTDPRR
ncbi:MAG TPA: DUF2298 domain-containing protein [Opitutaceae bacterium]|nr:DUF2298 domain-containing protein [Opitutaceae bacterium]